MARYSHASVGFGNGDCIVGVARPVDGVGFGSFSGSGSSSVLSSVDLIDCGARDGVSSVYSSRPGTCTISNV